MLRTRRRFQAGLESLEGKALLSALPILSQATFNQVEHLIDRAAGTFAKTHNSIAFDATLAQISYKIPYGHAQLYPTWQSDEGIYDPTVQGSGLAMVRQLKADLTEYVQTAVADGSMGVGGHWSSSLFASSSMSGIAQPPVLSHTTYQKALNQIGRVAGTFAKTHNENAFVASLSQISTTIPYGHDQLFPTWQSDVGIYNPSVRGSGLVMVQQLKTDLTEYVQTAVADGSIRFR
jgi:hypothetical protein